MTAGENTAKVNIMKLIKRYLCPQIASDLERKMVFIGGPRQVGKTTMAKQFLEPNSRGYLNWDNTQHRELILRQELPVSPIWIFDELHKYKQWRNYIKGIYDVHGDDHKIMVTGSAKLDYYRHGGESLQGRYHYLRLHPLSVAELTIDTQKDFLTLLMLGGFPEPFFQQSEIETRRWSREYRRRLLEEDLSNLENVKDLSVLELLMLRLPELVGSPLSINALREALNVSHKAVDSWLTIFERLYAIFRIPPFGAPVIRAVKKEQKHYHYDWTLIKDETYRFENLVGSQLLKWVHYQEDTQGKHVELRYFRDVDGREVDFVVTVDGHPIHAIECKWNDDDVSGHLKYFKAKFPDCNAWQLSGIGKRDYISKEKIRVCPALAFLRDLV